MRVDKRWLVDYHLCRVGIRGRDQCWDGLQGRHYLALTGIGRAGDPHHSMNMSINGFPDCAGDADAAVSMLFLWLEEGYVFLHEGISTPGFAPWDEAADVASWAFGSDAVTVSCMPEEFVEDKDLGTPAVPKAVVGHDSTRLRRRGAKTNALERLAGRLGFWWEDLVADSPATRARLWLDAAYAKSGVKFGLESESTVEADGVSGTVSVVQALFSSEEGSEWLWFCPELLAYLSNIRLFRPVSEMLMASLKSKARLWAREKGMSDMTLASVLPATVVLACVPTPAEVISVGSLRGSAGQWSVEVLGALSAGRLVASTRGGSWWDVLRPSLRFGGTKGSVLGGRHCPQLQAPK